MEDNNTDELFKITARNYQKLSQNLEKVKFQFFCNFLFICVGEEKTKFKFETTVIFLGRISRRQK